jgi:hypothetical protein
MTPYPIHIRPPRAADGPIAPRVWRRLALQLLLLLLLMLLMRMLVAAQ